MASNSIDHGEPPTFAKWLIWLFRKETWKEHPFIAAVAMIIVVGVMGTAIYSVYKSIPQRTTENEPVAVPVVPIEMPDPAPQKVVVLMDSTLPEVVYNPETRSKGGTNADDITEVIDDLRIVILKETTSLAWQRDEQILQINPNLIIIHLSAFYDQTNTRDSDRRLDTFLRFMAPSRAKFILYTRASSLKNREAQAEWIRRYEAQVPGLQTRLRLMFVPGGPSATFRDPNTARRLKLIVKETLEM